ncbi:hypothetical protein K8I61_18575 [bacterium]|nr:hypothetical protein [bacterium]
MTIHKWTAIAIASVFLLTAMSACDEAKDAIAKAAGDDGVWCLDELLELAGTSREELGDEGNDILEDVLSAQEDLLGQSFVIDCEATAAADEMTSDDDDAADDDHANDDDAADDDATDDGNENTRVAEDADDVPVAILDILKERGGPGEDVAVLVDGTASMGDDQQAVLANLDAILGEVKEQGGRLALAYFRDNQDCSDPWYGVNESGLVALDAAGEAEIEEFLSLMPHTGGCALPESLYDGIWETATVLDWQADVRLLISITDAPPLEGDDTNHSLAEVKAKLDELDIELNAITVGISY